MCRPAAVIMLIMTAAGQIGRLFYGGNQKARLGGETRPCGTAAGCGSSRQRGDEGFDSSSFRAVLTFICLSYSEL